MLKKLSLPAAILLAVTVLLSALPLAAEENDMLTVEVYADELIINIEGDFGVTDWIGIYPADHEGYTGSTIWWYIGDEGGTWSLPDDDSDVQRNIEGVYNEDGLIPGSYFAILLANDGYEPIDDMEPLYFEIKDPSEMPTKGPTAEPTEKPTPAPTAVPTEAPATEVPATAAPTEKAGDNTSPAASGTAGDQPGSDDSGSKAGLIIGIVCGVLVIAGAIAAILIVRKKKK